MGGWIGVDLDGTLAHYEGWNEGKIGAPIPKMLERVKRWLAEGKQVKIFTARVNGWHDQIRTQEALIHEWCLLHLGQAIPITHCKDPAMIELWDDRAVQVEPNTGRRVDGVEEEAL